MATEYDRLIEQRRDAIAAEREALAPSKSLKEKIFRRFAVRSEDELDTGGQSIIKSDTARKLVEEYLTALNLVQNASASDRAIDLLHQQIDVVLSQSTKLRSKKEAAFLKDRFTQIKQELSKTFSRDKASVTNFAKAEANFNAELGKAAAKEAKVKRLNKLKQNIEAGKSPLISVLSYATHNITSSGIGRGAAAGTGIGASVAGFGSNIVLGGAKRATQGLVGAFTNYNPIVNAAIGGTFNAAGLGTRLVGGAIGGLAGAAIGGLTGGTNPIRTAILKMVDNRVKANTENDKAELQLRRKIDRLVSEDLAESSNKKAKRSPSKEKQVKQTKEDVPQEKTQKASLDKLSKIQEKLEDWIDDRKFEEDKNVEFKTEVTEKLTEINDSIQKLGEHTPVLKNPGDATHTSTGGGLFGSVVGLFKEVVGKAETLLGDVVKSISSVATSLVGLAASLTSGLLGIGSELVKGLTKVAESIVLRGIVSGARGSGGTLGVPPVGKDVEKTAEKAAKKAGKKEGFFKKLLKSKKSLLGIGATLGIIAYSDEIEDAALKALEKTEKDPKEAKADLEDAKGLISGASTGSTIGTVVGAGIGGAVGSLAGGVGAVPGAVGGAVIGNRIGLAVGAVPSVFSFLSRKRNEYFARVRAGDAARKKSRVPTNPLPGLGGRSPVFSDVDPTIQDVIEKAAKDVGVSPGYLLALAKQESGFNPSVPANGSNALGLFQFTPGTWNDILARYGDKYPQLDRGRTDPLAASYAAALYVRENAQVLQKQGIPITGESLYATHFLGPRGAVTFLNAPDGADAAKVAGQAAASSNKSVFYDKEGKPRTVGEVRKLLFGKVASNTSTYQQAYGEDTQTELVSNSPPIPLAAAANTESVAISTPVQPETLNSTNFLGAGIAEYAGKFGTVLNTLYGGAGTAVQAGIAATNKLGDTTSSLASNKTSLQVAQTKSSIVAATKQIPAPIVNVPPSIPVPAAPVNVVVNTGNDILSFLNTNNLISRNF